MNVISERTLKLMRVALDPSAGDGEAATYWARALSDLRRDGVTVDDLVRASAPAFDAGAQIVVDEGVQPEFEVVMPWGKHKGKTLLQIFQQHAGYLDWCLANATNMTGSLRRAVEVVVNGAPKWPT